MDDSKRQVGKGKSVKWEKKEGKAKLFLRKE